MKNTLIIIAIFITFIFLYFLQANFFIWFTIAGVKPNLFILLLLFLGLFAGKRVSIPLGIVIGIMIDLLISKKIGMTGIMLSLIGILGAYFDKTFSKDSRITIILMVIGTTIIYEMGMYLMNTVIASTIIELGAFIKTLLIEVIYHVILTIILHPLIQKIGYLMEENFKGSQILTRYF